MTNPYELLLSPFKIGNVTLKNRMLNSKCVSSDEMEPELSGPFYEHLARNGAALVCVGVVALADCEGNYSRMAPCHMDDPKSRKAYMEIIDKIHAQGSLATASMMAIEPQNVMISDVPDHTRYMDGSVPSGFSGSLSVTSTSYDFAPGSPT